MNSVQDQIYQVVADTLDIKTAEVRLDSKWEDYKADSLDVVELILALEDKFNISFETAELNTLRSIADLVGTVQRKLEANTPGCSRNAPMQAPK